MKNEIIEYLFRRIDNGDKEEVALRETAKRYHKYGLRGRNFEESLLKLKIEYYGSISLFQKNRPS